MRAELTLAWPPSVNRYWRSVKGRVLVSAEGRAYRGSLRVAERFGTAPVGVSIAAYLPDLRKRDIDNLLKAPLDALTHAGAWADDSQIEDLSIRKAGIDRLNPRIEVRIWTLGQENDQHQRGGVQK